MRITGGTARDRATLRKTTFRPPHFRPIPPCILRASKRKRNMACILTLMGSVLGFVVGVTALILFDVPFIVALAIWSVTGVACVLLGLGMAVTAAAEQADAASQELA
jgi:cadmium resistance protein CadD (predicted permease)